MENETVNKDVKTLLAKLLATEDISVIHKNMPSAYFDTKNRELGLPILKNMSGDIYDLMTLHEVGHALWTDNEKWMKIVKKDNDDDLPKSFINVTEDVRIERKIKDKYPGGRRAFVSGYEKLFKDDFFGTAGKDIEEINLADKINLHSKVGDFTGVEFSDEENYREKLNTIKESYFPKVSKTSNVDDETTDGSIQDVDTTDTMKKYLSAISRVKKGAS